MAGMIRKSLIVTLAAWSLAASAGQAICAATVQETHSSATVAKPPGNLQCDARSERAPAARSLPANAELTDAPDGVVDGVFLTATRSQVDGGAVCGLPVFRTRLRTSLVSQHVQLQI